MSWHPPSLSSIVTYPFRRNLTRQPTFITLQTTPLLEASLPEIPPNCSGRTHHVLSIILSLQTRRSLPALQNALQDYEDVFGNDELDEEDEQDLETLKWEAIYRLIVRTYEECMGRLLEEARADEHRAEWWGRVERIGGGAGWYLIQTLPHRVMQLLQALRNQPNPLDALLHPTLRLPPPPHAQYLAGISPVVSHLFLLPLSLTPSLSLLNPVRLARLECQTHRLALTEARDERATAMARLLPIYDTLRNSEVNGDKLETATKLQNITTQLHSSLPIFSTALPPRVLASSQYAAYLLRTLDDLEGASTSHDELVRPHLPPSAITRLWPRFLLLPPLAYFALRTVYSSREDILAMLKNARETSEGFFKSWVIDPIKDILNTVRTGEGGMHVVSKEGLKSDLDSLERMALQLTSDKLHYTPEQQSELAESVRAGDLTPILRIYEEDIRSPIRSAIGGTLVRSLLIQVQKTKVDVDVALSGIDKLLRSQELTFAFVGVAPSLAVCYFLGSYLSRLWSSGRGRGRFGGERHREEVWLALRRTEKLLLAREPLSDLTQGLLLLSISTLRAYGQTYLPHRTRLKEGFLEDVAALEDVSLGREERRLVVARMRQDWSGALGWGTVAGQV